MDQTKLAATDPETYPTIDIGGKPVEIRFRSYDIIQLHKAGINLTKIDSNDLADVMNRTFELLHAGIAHAFETNPSEWPTSEQLSKTDLGDFGRITGLINESISKAMGRVTAALPAKTPTPQPDQTIQ